MGLHTFGEDRPTRAPRVSPSNPDLIATLIASFLGSCLPSPKKKTNPKLSKEWHCGFFKRPGLQLWLGLVDAVPLLPAVCGIVCMLSRA